MSKFYVYDFISPIPLIALVKEEFKSYFDTGAIDDTIFSIYLDNCLKKMGKGSYKIIPALLPITNFESRLPDDFFAVREAWLCTDVSQQYTLPGAQYQQVESTSTRLDTPDVYCDKCNECAMPDIIKAVYKTTFQAFAHFKQEYLLKQGNIWSKGDCKEECKNLYASGPESFDVHGNKFIVTFREGTVYILYYSKEMDCDGYQLIPDNFRIMEYMELYLKSKIYEQLTNQCTDEGMLRFFDGKYKEYDAKADEAYVIADIEAKKETVYDKHRKLKVQQHRFNRFNIS